MGWISRGFPSFCRITSAVVPFSKVGKGMSLVSDLAEGAGALVVLVDSAVVPQPVRQAVVNTNGMIRKKRGDMADVSIEFSNGPSPMGSNYHSPVMRNKQPENSL